jgi:hypothetical protein
LQKILLWQELAGGGFIMQDEELLDQILFPIYKITNQDDKDKVDTIFAFNVSKRKKKSIKQLNCKIKSLTFHRITMRNTFAHVQTVVSDGEKEFEMWYMLRREEMRFKLFDCAVKAHSLGFRVSRR